MGFECGFEKELVTVCDSHYLFNVISSIYEENLRNMPGGYSNYKPYDGHRIIVTADMWAEFLRIVDDFDKDMLPKKWKKIKKRISKAIKRDECVYFYASW